MHRSAAGSVLFQSLRLQKGSGHYFAKYSIILSNFRCISL